MWIRCMVDISGIADMPVGWGSEVGAAGWESEVATAGWGSEVAAVGWESEVAAVGWGSEVGAVGWGSEITTAGWGSVEVGAVNWRDGPGAASRMPVPKPDVMLAKAKVVWIIKQRFEDYVLTLRFFLAWSRFRSFSTTWFFDPFALPWLFCGRRGGGHIAVEYWQRTWRPINKLSLFGNEVIRRWVNCRYRSRKFWKSSVEFGRRRTRGHHHWFTPFASLCALDDLCQYELSLPMPRTEFEKWLSAFKFFTCCIPFSRVRSPKVYLADVLVQNLRRYLHQKLVDNGACSACDRLDCRTGDHCTIDMPDNFVESDACFVGRCEVNTWIRFAVFKCSQYGLRILRRLSRAVEFRCQCARGCGVAAINRVREWGGTLTTRKSM